ncbi:MAG: hypothetical protein ABR521_07410 [Gaiellaceae bacterium]
MVSLVVSDMTTGAADGQQRPHIADPHGVTGSTAGDPLTVGHRFLSERSIGGRLIWEFTNAELVVERWPKEHCATLEVVAHLLGLEHESRYLGRVNRRGVQLGGEPIPVRPQFRMST